MAKVLLCGGVPNFRHLTDFLKLRQASEWSIIESDDVVTPVNVARIIFTNPFKFARGIQSLNSECLRFFKSFPWITRDNKNLVSIVKTAKKSVV